MKSFSLVMMGILSISTTASASQVLLGYRAVAGLGGPSHARSRECRIKDDGQVYKTQMGFMTPTRGRPIAWTAQVKNARAIADLSVRARRGKLVRGLSRPGGNTVTYFEMLSGTENMLAVKGSRNIENTSAAAKALVAFIEFNCSQQ